MTVWKVHILSRPYCNVYKELSTVLPFGAMKHEKRGHLILIYSFNGDSRKKERIGLIKTLSRWISQPADEKEFSISEESTEAGNNYGLVMFYDADDKGIDARINEVKTEIGPLFSCANTLNNNGDIVYDDEKFKVGVYIFADHKFASGTLENILLPLMKQGNEEIFNDAEKFLNKHKNNDHRMKPLKFVKDEAGNISERRSDRANKYHHAKSLLGVVGQLQNSGTSNTVCIEKADYITLGKISASQPCQEIIDLFKRI